MSEPSSLKIESTSAVKSLKIPLLFFMVFVGSLGTRDGGGVIIGRSWRTTTSAGGAGMATTACKSTAVATKAIFEAMAGLRTLSKRVQAIRSSAACREYYITPMWETRDLKRLPDGGRKSSIVDLIKREVLSASSGTVPDHRYRPIVSLPN